MVDYKHPYTLVLLGNLLIAIQYLVTVYLYVMTARIRIYRRTHMRQFDEIHEQHFGKGTKAPEYGYPDTGNGWYSQKLPYKDWYDMNCA